MEKLIFIIIFTFFCLKVESSLGADFVSGRVFLDLNFNGLQDFDEPGVKGVDVIVGDNISTTDKDGNYIINYFSSSTKNAIAQIALELKTLPQNTFFTRDPKTVLSLDGNNKKIDFAVYYNFRKDVLAFPEESIVHVSKKLLTPNIFVKGNIKKGLLSINKKTESFLRAKIKIETESFGFLSDDSRGVSYIDVNKNKLNLKFKIDIEDKQKVKWWNVVFYDSSGEEIFRKRDFKDVPVYFSWDGKNKEGIDLLKSQIYAYQLEVEYIDGKEVASSINFFVTGSEYLKVFKISKIPATQKGRFIIPQLNNIKHILRKYPQSQIIIEGPKGSSYADSFMRSISGLIEKSFNPRKKTSLVSENGLKIIYIKIIGFPKFEFKSLNNIVKLSGGSVQISARGEFEQNLYVLDLNGDMDLRIFRDDGVKFFSKIENRRVAVDASNSSDVILNTKENYLKTKLNLNTGKPFYDYFISGNVPIGSLVSVDGKFYKPHSDGNFHLPIKVSIGKNDFNIQVFYGEKEIYNVVYRIHSIPVLYGNHKDKKIPFILFSPETFESSHKKQLLIRGFTIPYALVLLDENLFSSDRYGNFSGLISPNFFDGQNRVRVFKSPEKYEFIYNFENKNNVLNKEAL